MGSPRNGGLFVELAVLWAWISGHRDRVRVAKVGRHLGTFGSLSSLFDILPTEHCPTARKTPDAIRYGPAAAGESEPEINNYR